MMDDSKIYRVQIYKKKAAGKNQPLEMRGELHPIKYQLTKKAEPPSTASITIPNSDPAV